MGRAPTLVLCSRNAHDQNVLVRRPHLDQHACPSRREKLSELGRIICINRLFDLGCASSRDPPLFTYSLLARLEGMWTEVFDMASAKLQWVLTATHDGLATLRRSTRVVRGEG